MRPAGVRRTDAHVRRGGALQRWHVVVEFPCFYWRIATTSNVAASVSVDLISLRLMPGSRWMTYSCVPCVDVDTFGAASPTVLMELRTKEENAITQTEKLGKSDGKHHVPIRPKPPCIRTPKLPSRYATRMAIAWWTCWYLSSGCRTNRE